MKEPKIRVHLGAQGAQCWRVHPQPIPSPAAPSRNKSNPCNPSKFLLFSFFSFLLFKAKKSTMWGAKKIKKIKNKNPPCASHWPPPGFQGLGAGAHGSSATWQRLGERRKSQPAAEWGKQRKNPAAAVVGAASRSRPPGAGMPRGALCIPSLGTCKESRPDPHHAAFGWHCMGGTCKRPPKRVGFCVWGAVFSRSSCSVQCLFSS